MVTVEQLTEKVLQLPEEQRVSLVQRVLEQSEASPSAESAWQKEIQRRISELDAGRAETHSMENVFAELDRKLNA